MPSATSLFHTTGASSSVLCTDAIAAHVSLNWPPCCVLCQLTVIVLIFVSCMHSGAAIRSTDEHGKPVHGDNTFRAHDPKVLQFLKEQYPSIALQLPFTCLGSSFVSHAAAVFIHDLVYRQGAGAARDLCVDLKAQQYYRLQLTYFTHHQHHIQTKREPSKLAGPAKSSASGQKTLFQCMVGL